MDRAPSRLAEAIVAFFIPPACREHVLGDLHERYASPFQYFAEASCTVPLVIFSRIRRTADATLCLMEALVLYLSYLAAAWFLDRTFLTIQNGLARLAIPAAIALVVLILGDAYADPKKRSPLRPILSAALAIGFASLSQAAPQWILILGSSLSILLISGVRFLFPPVTDRPQGASGPAFWLKRTVEPVRISTAMRVVAWLAAAGVIAIVAELVGLPRLLRPGSIVIVCVLLVLAQLRRKQ